jgi:hypothetical protein
MRYYVVRSIQEDGASESTVPIGQKINNAGRAAKMPGMAPVGRRHWSYFAPLYCGVLAAP